MSYFVSIDPDTKEYFARLSNSQQQSSSAIGKGDSLYAAIDDLENKLKGKTKKGELSLLFNNSPSYSEEILAIPIPH
jgi:hypothetical protein